jgi:hypothetical protein
VRRRSSDFGPMSGLFSLTLYHIILSGADHGGLSIAEAERSPFLKIHSLSHGIQRRVATARAHGPQVNLRRRFYRNSATQGLEGMWDLRTRQNLLLNPSQGAPRLHEFTIRVPHPDEANATKICFNLHVMCVLYINLIASPWIRV